MTQGFNYCLTMPTAFSYNMGMKLGKEKLSLSKKGLLDVNKVVSFFMDVLGYDLIPVKGQDNSYWFSGINGVEALSGPKYYKLIFDNWGVEIDCIGMINAFHMKHWIADDIKVNFINKNHKK